MVVYELAAVHVEDDARLRIHRAALGVDVNLGVAVILIGSRESLKGLVALEDGVLNVRFRAGGVEDGAAADLAEVGHGSKGAAAGRPIRGRQRVAGACRAGSAGNARAGNVVHELAAPDNGRALLVAVDGTAAAVAACLAAIAAPAFHTAAVAAVTAETGDAAIRGVVLERTADQLRPTATENRHGAAVAVAGPHAAMTAPLAVAGASFVVHKGLDIGPIVGRRRTGAYTRGSVSTVGAGRYAVGNHAIAECGRTVVLTQDTAGVGIAHRIVTAFGTGSQRRSRP